MPKRSKCADACIAIQFAADDAPYVMRHCMSPPTRGACCIASIPVLARSFIAARSRAAYVASHTVRKQRTWLHSPPATASIAAITAPP